MPEDLLVEIGCEEIPARVVADLARQFASALGQRLHQSGLMAADAPPPRSAYTPRRLMLSLSGLLDRQPDRAEQIVGPPLRVGVGSDGSYTPQAVGFATKLGLSAGDLIRVATVKGEYVAVVKHTPGRAALALLAELVPQAFAALELPRSMVWRADSGQRFIRPVRWVLALLGAEIIPFQLGGLPAGRASFGHRTLGPGPFSVPSAQHYPDLWRQHFVLPDPAERVAAVESALAAAGVRVRPDAALLDTLVNLTEYPGAVVGDFDPAFLTALPEEVLVTVMRDHQKYFAVEDADHRLVPQFAAVINLDADRQGLIRHGNERVLRARFKDAQFFWDTDRKTTLAARLGLLDQVTFQAKLGSYRQKSERISQLAGWLASLWPGSDTALAREAALLSKCDLTSELVKEFTELQGIMGGRYAEAEGKPPALAAAIADQYQWETAPRTLAGVAVSVADKLDTIAGMFALGEVPTGSSDPFALRRQGNGIIRALVDRQLRLSLARATAEALGLYGAVKTFRPQDETVTGLAIFFAERLAFFLRDGAGYTYDTVAAVLAAGSDDPLDASVRAAAVSAARLARPREFSQVAAALKRMRNIVRKEGGMEKWASVEVNSSLLTDPAEIALRDAVTAVNAGAGYEAELAAISQLWQPLDRFFHEVRVNADDQRVRANRLALLAWSIRQLSRVADFGEIVVPSELVPG